MGLDMYLTARRYFYPPTLKPEDDVIADEVAKIVGVSQRVKYVIVEAMYWRKANAIHKWFVDNLGDGEDNCQKMFVSRDDLKVLIGLCEQVIATPGNTHKLLPAVGGFFFGSTEYDEYYMEDINRTRAGLIAALELSEAWDFTYQASW